MSQILVVDDDQRYLKRLVDASQASGAQITTAVSGDEAIRNIQSQDFDVVVTDLAMETPDAGLEVLRAAKDKDKFTQVILITHMGTKAISVLAMSLGAYDYIEKRSRKTDSLAKLRIQVGKALEYRELKLAARSA
jgi:DNA-binding NtrC family response regulator